MRLNMVALGIGIGFHTSSSDWQQFLVPGFLALTLALLTKWTLKRSLATGRAPDVNRALLGALGLGYAMLFIGALFR